jgi:hypothetical protein
MNTLPVTFPSGATGYASLEDVAAAVRHLLLDEIPNLSSPGGRDECARDALNEDYYRSIIQSIVDRATERGIVARSED